MIGRCRRTTKKREPLGQRDVARHERRAPEDGSISTVAAPGPRRVSGDNPERRVVLRNYRAIGWGARAPAVNDCL